MAVPEDSEVVIAQCGQAGDKGCDIRAHPTVLFKPEGLQAVALHGTELAVLLGLLGIGDFETVRRGMRDGRGWARVSNSNIPDRRRIIRGNSVEKVDALLTQSRDLS